MCYGLEFAEIATFKIYTYDVIDLPLTWSDAQLFCESRDSQLVKIASREENEYLNGYTTPEYSGCTDTE